MDEQMPKGQHEYLSRRERRMMQRQRGMTTPGDRRSRRRVLLWSGMIIALALIGWGMVKLSAGVPLPDGNGGLADPVTDADHSKGPADAAVTLVEYSDFQCPACAAFKPIVEKALAETALKDRIRFVYRSFPLTNIHANSMLAARAAEAAALQGKFWEFHDILFTEQSTWSGLSDQAAREVMRSYADRLKLDVDRFVADIDGQETEDAVKRQIASGERSGINATPTFFINGNRMPQPDGYEQFVQFLTDALPHESP